MGIVLGAGGVTGDAFHRGVLRALWQAGYDARTADVIVGTSAGSAVAAQLRRPDLRPAGVRGQTVHGTKLSRRPELTPWLGLLRHPWRVRAGVLTTSLLPTGRRSTEFLVSGLRSHHGDGWPERPLYVCAVRRRDGRRVVFGRAGAPATDLPRAVAASCAIPGYFHPIEIGGEVYVDGGVHSPTNADVLADHDLDILIVSSPMSVDPRSIRPVLDLGVRLGFHGYLRRELAPYRRRARGGRPLRVVTFEPGGALLSVMGINPLSAHRIDEVEAESFARAEQVLAAHRDVVDTLPPGRVA